MLLTYNSISVMYDESKPGLSGSACDEPFGRELMVERLRVERLPSASSGLEPVESSRVDFNVPG